MADTTRNTMTDFWSKHSLQGSIEEMMLDDSASKMADEESNEILSMLPNIHGKKVIELGAGIGRFTGRLAQMADSVVTVDFMQTFMDKNEATHNHMGNIDFICADVTKLKLAAGSADVVFSNWLFMYLADEEVKVVLKNILLWLKDDGVLFFRESCFHPSGNIKRGENPTFYRSPVEYAKLLHSAYWNLTDSEKCACYDVVFTRPVRTYIKHKSNSNQLCWLMKKTQKSQKFSNGFKTQQEVIDFVHYPYDDISLMKESIADNDTTKEIYTRLKLDTGSLILDVGCGAGGDSFYMAENYNAHVIGVDLSANMITHAMKELNKTQDRRVFFVISDLTEMKFAPETFDAIHCRETLFHVEKKDLVFRDFYKWLKPGGQILVTDYLRRSEKEIVMDYQVQNGYHFISLEDYIELTEAVGFSGVIVTDETPLRRKILKDEMDNLMEKEAELLETHSMEDFTSCVSKKKTILSLCDKDALVWGVLSARKPSI